MSNACIKSSVCCLFIFLLPLCASADSTVNWEKVEDGFWQARYAIDNLQSIIKPEVLLLRFDSNRFSFHVSQASQVGKVRADIESLTESSGGVAGVNASFFDEHGAPIGLLVVDGKQLQKIHHGGNLLTGVFYVSRTHPKIVHRSDFTLTQVSQAIQAGPRLVVDGKRVRVSAPDAPSRRSGVALTKDKHIIIFATTLRFPGVSLTQIQDMLLEPKLEVVDALNLDGGSSSQLYLAANKTQDELLISGGDVVPVGISVRRKVQQEK